MPSAATITAFYTFTALTKIKSADMNTNFSTFRGHFLPVDLTAAAAAPTNTYDLGAPDHRWRNIYGVLVPSVVSTTGSMSITGVNDVVLMNSTSATITASLVTAVGFNGMIRLKNIGNGGKTVFVDANGTEKIDNTLTVNLVDLESTSLISDNANWWTV